MWSKILEYKLKLKKIYNIDLDLYFISPHLSIMNSLELGLNSNFLNTKKTKLIYLLNINFINKFKNFKLNNDFIIYQGHHGNEYALNSNVVLPSPTFLEKKGHFITLQGFFEREKWPVERISLPQYHYFEESRQ